MPLKIEADVHWTSCVNALFYTREFKFICIVDTAIKIWKNAVIISLVGNFFSRVTMFDVHTGQYKLYLTYNVKDVVKHVSDILFDDESTLAAIVCV